MNTAAIQPMVLGTPLEDHLAEAGLLVKREDLSCPPPGPPFSKTRGVLSHMKARYDEGVRVFGALDTFHSQAGHAVAWGAALLGAQCLNYFPVYKRDVRPAAPSPEDQAEHHLYQWEPGMWMELREPQKRSAELGAELIGLGAGRSAVLYHTARAMTGDRGGYMMPNALKLPETVEETAAEVERTFERASREQFDILRSSPWLIACSSATIAAGVMAGLGRVLPAKHEQIKRVILHMGYSRSREAVFKYLSDRLGFRRWLYDWHEGRALHFVDEGYEYKDTARPGPTPPWPCNDHYDLKALRWWLREGRQQYGRAIFWNIG